MEQEIKLPCDPREAQSYTTYTFIMCFFSQVLVSYENYGTTSSLRPKGPLYMSQGRIFLQIFKRINSATARF